MAGHKTIRILGIGKGLLYFISQISGFLIHNPGQFLSLALLMSPDML